MLAVANTGSCVDPQSKIGHLAGCWLPRNECSRNINRFRNVLLFLLVLRSAVVDRICMSCGLRKKKKTYGVMTCGMNNLVID